MKGNSAIIKCLIPSFVADFVHVVAWIDETNEEILYKENSTTGIDIKSNNACSLTHFKYTYTFFRPSISLYYNLYIFLHSHIASL